MARYLTKFKLLCQIAIDADLSAIGFELMFIILLQLQPSLLLAPSNKTESLE